MVPAIPSWLAFNTGLWFVDPGLVSLRQVPIPFDTESVPLPGAVILAGLGLGLSGRLCRRKNSCA